MKICNFISFIILYLLLRLAPPVYRKRARSQEL